MEILGKLFNEDPANNKIALIQLIPAVYPHVSPSYKTNITNYIQKLSIDDNLSVKREFYNNLKVSVCI